MKQVERNISFHNAKKIIIEEMDFSIAIFIPGMERPIKFKNFSFLKRHNNHLSFHYKGNEEKSFNLLNLIDPVSVLLYISKQLNKNIRQFTLPKKYLFSMKDLKIEGNFGFQFSERIKKLGLSESEVLKKFCIFQITKEELKELINCRVPKRLDEDIFYLQCSRILGKNPNFKGSKELFWKLLNKNKK
jgi:hypothetical protein